MRGMVLGLCCVSLAVPAQGPRAEVVFREDFSDATLPAWRAADDVRSMCSPVSGPDGTPAVSIERKDRGNAMLAVSLPVARVAGKAVLLEVWRKAENVRTGAEHYHNAKAMLSWKGASAAKPSYSTTEFSDFSGTFDWERHRYVAALPPDLEWVSVSIGLQSCSGKASWAGLTVSLDPRFPTQAALERFLQREEEEAYTNIAAETLRVKSLEGGVIQVFSGTRHVPRRYWNDTVREAVLAVAGPGDGLPVGGGAAQAARLAQALRARAEGLAEGVSALTGLAASDRVYEIASLRERVRQLGAGLSTAPVVRLAVDATAEIDVNPLVFGNNINTQNLTASYDSERGRFQDGFLQRVRPMGITFLRYPGGCNADVFNWRDTIGPMAGRKDVINYHNGSSRGPPRFGVDEYLRFCDEEGMTPIITTAFCKDHPAKVDPNDHPNGVRHPFVFSYLRSAPERVRLAADWVEYCNGSADTPLGALRARHGHPEPYGVKYWEIGNESYGPDPAGSCSPEEYGNAFPAYVEAMKARDATISIVMNGAPSAEWNDTVLRLAGRHADAFQFHIYLTPRLRGYTKLEGQPHQITAGMRLSDSIHSALKGLETLMRKHLGRTLPVIVSEFGMGNARNREFMTSVTSPVLVADMWRALIESPLVLGANKWCLFTGYWFSQVQGPTLERPDAPYYNRPEQAMHVIYARCRGDRRLAVDNEASDGAKAVVFTRGGSYGVVLVSREAVSWQSVVLDLPGARSGAATCLLLTAGHPFLGNENDHDLVRACEFGFDYAPGEAIALPSNSVMGLVVPRQPRSIDQR